MVSALMGSWAMVERMNRGEQFPCERDIRQNVVIFGIVKAVMSFPLRYGNSSDGTSDCQVRLVPCYCSSNQVLHNCDTLEDAPYYS